ncbi:LEA type 2 family protein [Adhaeribacter sp. BT258]|uniref:LEA type 2 family protein n=1 Tax=Adhaeribacter terrigena TaxID=2793070 RepID=A0ABS1C5K0_9BACT|nr:LEA type 2 family protein [Adhaeribacter terrigena]MBK0404649.1 LEA type 2 family protein [Adhaeribacter terrigena]
MAGILLLVLAGVFFYFNRKPFYPEVREVTYLQLKLEDTIRVQAGVRVQNMAPFSFQVDSISYLVSYKGVKLGWGSEQWQRKLPAFKNQVFGLQLFLDKDRYKILLQRTPQPDSLELDLKVQLYIDPPFLQQQTISLHRTFFTAIPKSPSLQIDSFFVKSFSPEAGYVFQLNLNTQNTDLPNLRLADLKYRIKLTDSVTLNGQIDTVVSIKSNAPTVQVPIHLKTSELIEGLALKLGKQKVFAYQAQATATLKTDHHLFENTALTVTRNGTLDTRKFDDEKAGLPTVKHIRRLELINKQNTAYLEAEIVIHNPTMLPLYLDSARYLIRSGGKVIATGGNEHNKVLPSQKDQRLKLNLAVNKQHYKQLLKQPKNQNNIPLDVDLLLLYNFKNSKPQQLAIKKNISVPVTGSPTFELADLGVKELDPEKGAQLFVKLKVENQHNTNLRIDDLHYKLLVKNGIDLSGKTQKPIVVNAGTTEIEIPVDISGPDVNQLAKGLMQGVETWPYTFAATASVSTPNSLLHQTEVSVNTSSVYQVNSKGSPDYMPEISKIDTLNVTIRYDTAWVHMYAAIYNTLPATIHLSHLQVDVIHERDTIAKSEEELNLYLAPNANSFAWHTLGVKYGLWEEHVNHHQHEDSIRLNFPATMYFDLGNLGRERADLDLHTKIPTPASPVTLLQRLKLRGFGFGQGLQFDALVAVQNTNSPGLTVKSIAYQIDLENGVDICGKINRAYQIPLGVSEVKVPINLSVWETLKLLKRQFFGPPLLDYKINATAQFRTDNPKLSDVYVIFENWNQTDLREKKTLQAAQ